MEIFYLFYFTMNDEIIQKRKAKQLLSILVKYLEIDTLTTPHVLLINRKIEKKMEYIKITNPKLYAKLYKIHMDYKEAYDDIENIYTYYK